jgi:hypothetical protein
MRSQVKLTPALQIGFSGHMKLSNESLCRDQILKVLSEWKAKFPDGIGGLSSLAGRFLEMRRLILDYGKQLEQTQSWTSVLRVVSRVEKTLLTEVIDGGVVSKPQILEMRFPRTTLSDQNRRRLK